MGTFASKDGVSSKGHTQNNPIKLEVKLFNPLKHQHHPHNPLFENHLITDELQLATCAEDMTAKLKAYTISDTLGRKAAKKGKGGGRGES